MGSIKDKALKNNKEKKYTLSESQIDVLMQYRKVAQVDLDRMLQDITSVYLHSIAVSEHGYSSNSNLGFSLALEKPEDNFIVTEL